VKTAKPPERPPEPAPGGADEDRVLVAAEDLGMSFQPRRRQRVQALDGIDLQVPDGEFLAVVGRSGCGKSTLLRLIAGLLAPTRGRLAVAVNRPGFMFQDPALAPWLTVRGNVELSGRLDKLPERQRRALAAEAMDALGISELADRLPHQLSGGQASRVALARALTRHSRLLLLDEPFAKLDAITRDELHALMQTLREKQGFTAVLVTHAIDEAVQLADRIAVMAPGPGRITATVPVDLPFPRPSQVRADPRFGQHVEHVRALLGLAGAPAGTAPTDRREP
jgi:NitT/TauT family transport system ATP-binding protein